MLTPLGPGSLVEFTGAIGLGIDRRAAPDRNARLVGTTFERIPEFSLTTDANFPLRVLAIPLE